MSCAYDWERYENTPVVCYGPHETEYHLWYRVCPNCGRFVKNDEYTKIPEYLGKEPNATCKRCGRVQMPFCGWQDATIFEEAEG